MRTYRRLCAVVAGLLLLGFLIPSVLAQQPKPEHKGAPKTPPRPQLTVKVFKLERANPEEVIEAMNNLLESPDMEVAGPMPGGAVPGGPGPMGGLGFAGGGIGGLGGAGGNSTPLWRATFDERTKAVVVRGSARHLQVAADLVAILDRKADSPLPQLQVIKAFALKHANAMDLVNVIDQLAFEDVRLSSPGEKLLAVIGPDEATKAIADVVKELDVPVKADPEAKKEKEPEPKKVKEKESEIKKEKF